MTGSHEASRSSIHGKCLTLACKEKATEREREIKNRERERDVILCSILIL